MPQPDQATIEHWHRWFAVELNNLAWDLGEKSTRSAAEDREMLAAAYGAAFHWNKVGKPVNTVRASVLLAHAHSLLGEGEPALRYAREALSLCEAHGFADWDLASVHIALARGAAAAGDAALHAEQQALATSAVDAISDEEDRAIMAKSLASVPRSVVPGGV